MALKFEELKSKVDTHIQYLQKFKNVTNDKTHTALRTLRNTLYEIADPQTCALYLIKEGFCPLFMELWKRLSKYLTKDRGSDGHRNLLALLGLSLTASDKSREFGDELVSCGWVPCLLSVINEDGLSDDIRALYILGGMFNCIRLSSNNRDTYRSANAISILQPFLKSTNVEIQTNALIVLAYVVNEKDREILATSESGLKQLLVVLRNGVKSEYHSAAIGNTGFSICETLDAINQLAINDTSKAEIERQGAIPAIIRMLQDDFSDDEHRVAVEALWNLSFMESIRESETLQSTIPALEKLTKSNNKDVQRVAVSALWQIKGSDSKNVPQGSTTGPSSCQESSTEPEFSKSSPAKVMLSYQWDYKERVLTIREKLRNAGYSVWMDVSSMEGDILGAMAKGVEESDVILMCMSERYKDSKSCRSEATYAYKLHKKIIPLRMEPGYTPDGWLGLLQGMDLYYPCHSDDELDRNIPALLKVIKESTSAKSQEVVGAKDTVDGEGPITPTSQSSVPCEDPPSSSHAAALDWSAQDVQDWLSDNNFQCPALDYYKGNGLQELYRQLTDDVTSFKAEMKSEYNMNVPTCNRFIAELRQLFKR